MSLVPPLVPAAEPLSVPAPAPVTLSVVGDTTTIAALPADVRLRLYAGDDFTMRLGITDSAGRRVNLTGATVRSHIRAEPWPSPPPTPGPTPSPPPLLGEFVPAIGDSEIFLHLTHAMSVALPAASVWDVDLTLGGVTTTLAGGTITITPEVSR